MAENKLYLAVGEESVRGIKESGVVGFVPLLNGAIPALEFDEKKRKEFRGEDTVKGDSVVKRMSRRWSTSLETPVFTESGSTKGVVGTMLKHFFGKVSSNQRDATTAYSHMMYPVADPFDSANLDTKALTLNLNINEGSTMKNWPYSGGRVTALSFNQEAGNHLSLAMDMVGQKREASTSEIGSPVFAEENLRCDYNNLSIYTGTVGRTGSSPDFTEFDFSSSTAIKPDKVSVKIENGMEDVLRLSGVDYPDKTRLGIYKVTVELTIDWEDPASGFSSVDEFNSWVSSVSTTNLAMVWDTGTEAGTGFNHKLVLDLPNVYRTGGEPEFDLEKDPMVTLTYEGLYDSSTGYMVGCFLQNSAVAL